VVAGVNAAAAAVTVVDTRTRPDPMHDSLLQILVVADTPLAVSGRSDPAGHDIPGGDTALAVPLAVADDYNCCDTAEDQTMAVADDEQQAHEHACC